jgi:hypothetical protein
MIVVSGADLETWICFETISATEMISETSFSSLIDLWISIGNEPDL